MYTGMLHLHNLLRWVVLLFLLIAIVRHLMGMTSSKNFTSGDRKTGLFLMISAHLTFVVGVYLWLAGNWGLKKINELGMSGVMKDSYSRFFVIEHLAAMLIAVILITIGRGVSKKIMPDTVKHRRSFWFYFIALILILVSIPWPFRETVARPWAPGM